MDFITVSIKNWDAFNYRKDVSSPSWFRFAHNFFEDPQFYDFTHSEMLAWLYLLCQASKKSKGDVRVFKKHLEVVGKIKFRDFESAIKKLQNLDIISISAREVNVSENERNVDDTLACSTQQDKTRQNKTINLDQASSGSTVCFDFDSVYEKYPRKEGKSIGLRKLKADIQSQKDYEGLSLALTRYVEHCKSNATEHRFIKHFSSWVSHWRDWLDPKTGTGLDFSSGESGLSLTERLKLKEEKRKRETEAST